MTNDVPNASHGGQRGTVVQPAECSACALERRPCVGPSVHQLGYGDSVHYSRKHILTQLENLNSLWRQTFLIPSDSQVRQPE